jgi:hypothetical protein
MSAEIPPSSSVIQPSILSDPSPNIQSTESSQPISSLVSGSITPPYQPLDQGTDSKSAPIYPIPQVQHTGIPRPMPNTVTLHPSGLAGVVHSGSPHGARTNPQVLSPIIPRNNKSAGVVGKRNIVPTHIPWSPGPPVLNPNHGHAPIHVPPGNSLSIPFQQWSSGNGPGPPVATDVASSQQSYQSITPGLNTYHNHLKQLPHTRNEFKQYKNYARELDYESI